MAKAAPLFCDTTRRNWGYWDGVSDAKTGKRPEWEGKSHYDPHYEAGYWAGRNEEAR